MSAQSGLSLDAVFTRLLAATRGGDVQGVVEGALELLTRARAARYAERGHEPSIVDRAVARRSMEN